MGTESEATPRPGRRQSPFRLARIGDHMLLTAAAFVMGAPLALVFLGAARPGGTGGRGDGATLLDGWAANLDRLATLTANTGAPPLSGMLASSLGLALGVAAVTTAVAFLAACAMVLAPDRVTRICFAITLATLLFPVEARLLPTFDVTVRLALTGTWTGMVLPVLPLALATLVFRQHLRGLPPELREAARLDGAGTAVFLRDFALPLSAAPAGAVFLIAFIYGWNQYLWPLMVSIDDGVYPLMRGLNLAGTASGPGLVIAATSMLPPLVLVLCFLRLLARVTAIRA